MNWLILSTILHFYSIVPLLSNYEHFTGYIHVIILSTTLSVLYHTDESNVWIAGLDHLMTFIWFLYDLELGWSKRFSFFRIIHSNLISFIIYRGSLEMKPYVLYHSLWHLFNAAKCYYVATLLPKE